MYELTSACSSCGPRLRIPRWSTFRPLGQLKLGVEPRSTFRPPDMHLRSLLDWRIQTTHAQKQGVVRRPVGHDMRATLRAEISCLARRGFKTLEQMLAPDPAKAIARHVRHRGEGGAVRLSAC